MVMSWYPTQSIWNEAGRKAARQRKELHDSAAYQVIQNPNLSVLQAEAILLAAHRRKHGAAETTIDALMYLLRRGLSALEPSDPVQRDTLRRLSELTEMQIKDCCKKLGNRRPHIGPAWTKDELAKLALVWKGVCK